MARLKEKKSTPGKIGSNIAGLNEDISAARDKILSLKKERAEINAKIKAECARIEAKGITKRAFDAAMSYMDLDVSGREGYDQSYIISRAAMGLPVKGAQLDMFEEKEEGDVSEVTDISGWMNA